MWRTGVWVNVYGFACFGSKFPRVDEVLYVVAHAKKMVTDLLGIIQIRQKAANF